MLKFLKYAFATLVGTIVGLFLFFIIGIGILVGIASSASSEKEVTVEPNSVLKISLKSDIQEKSNDNPFANLDYSTLKPNKSTGLYEMIAAIRKAKTDDNIKGIYIDVFAQNSGYATLSALRDELLAFRKGGKFVYAYANVYEQKSYFLATAADKIFMNPSGMMILNGFGREIMYYKGMFDKFGIEVQDFHCGQFKSAIEPFVRTNMSEQNRTQLLNIYGDIYSQFATKIADARKLDTATFSRIINNLEADNAEHCKELKLVDEVAYYDQVLAALKTKTGTKKDDDLEFIEISKYATTVKDDKESDNKIAIVFAQGEIVDGDGDEGQIGGDAFAKTIRKAREDKKVKAIVLRVNSPGGSALASDIMWRELMLAKKEKPLIVSMGDLAASGGYFIACPADKIFAQPTTITGSIGVFGLIPNAQKLFNEKLGLTFDHAELNEHGDFGGGTKPLDAVESAFVQRSVERTYREFKERVAAGRGKDTAYIETIAQGHVWTGNQGIANGLVDAIGNLDDAIAEAAKRANLKDYRVKTYPEEKSFGEQLSEAFGDAKASVVKEQLGEQYELFQMLKRMQHMQGVQMRLVYEVL